MGRSKGYRRPAVKEALIRWRAEFGDRAFTANELYKSGLIQFKMSQQFITITSLRLILASQCKQGYLVEVGKTEKRRAKYQVIESIEKRVRSGA